MDLPRYDPITIRNYYCCPYFFGFGQSPGSGTSQTGSCLRTFALAVPVACDMVSPDVCLHGLPPPLSLVLTHIQPSQCLFPCFSDLQLDSGPFRTTHSRASGSPRALHCSPHPPVTSNIWVPSIKDKHRVELKNPVLMAKENISKMKMEPTVWENIFANNTSDKDLISKI